MYDHRIDLSPEDAPPLRRIEAKVKWFNASKGFGFVTMTDGSPDAFLPMAILRRAGYEDVREGASITCEVGAGAKGPLVTNVIHIDASTAVAPGFGDRRAQRPSSSLEGAVKWFGPRLWFHRPMAARDVHPHHRAARHGGLENRRGRRAGGRRRPGRPRSRPYNPGLTDPSGPAHRPARQVWELSLFLERLFVVTRSKQTARQSVLAGR